MKLISATILVLLVATPILSQGEPAATCVKTAGFLKWIEKRVPGSVLANPNTTGPFDVCGEVWGTSALATYGGSCCDAAKIKTHFEAEMGKHKEKWDKFVKSVGKVRNAAKKMEKAKPAPAEKDQLARFEEKRADLENNGIKPEEAVKAIKDGGSLEADIELFRTEGKKCFEATIAEKSKFFCYGCAAKGNGEYFSDSANDKEIKFNIKAGSCKNLLEQCLKTWDFMTKVKQFVSVTDRLAKALEKKTDGLKPPPAVFGARGPGDVRKDLDDCKGSITTNDVCTNEKLDRICVAFFNFHKPEKVADEVEDTAVRLLQDTTEESAAMTANGVPMDVKVTGPTFSALSSINFGDAGKEAQSFSKIASMGLVALMSVVVSFMF